MSFRDCYLDLDPTYKDPHGRPLMRMTFDWKDNGIRMTQFMRRQIETIVESMNPTSWGSGFKQPGAQYDVVPISRRITWEARSWAPIPRHRR